MKAELPDYAKLPYLDADKTYKSGDTGTNVKVAQKMLKALGYKVKVNSMYDQDFVSVVKQFQKKEKLNETGILTGDTTTKLMIELQKKLSDNDTQMEKAIETLKKEM